MEIAQDEIFALDAIPERGAFVVVPSTEIRARVQRQVVEHLGSEIAGRTKVVVIRDRDDVDKIVGDRHRVFLDPAFAGAVKATTLDRVLQLARGSNARFRK